MKASPLRPCFAERAYRFGLCGDLTVALTALDGEPSDSYLADLSGLRKYLVVGAGAAAWLGTQGLAAPDWLLRATGADGRWVARTGAARYLLSEGAQSPGALCITPGRLSGDTLVLAQDSVEIALGGSLALTVLSEFCAIDLSHCTAEAWVPVQLAQLDVGLYSLPHAFHLICAPADAQFLFSTLTEALSALGGAVIGFADYQQKIGGGVT